MEGLLLVLGETTDQSVLHSQQTHAERSLILLLLHLYRNILDQFRCYGDASHWLRLWFFYEGVSSVENFLVTDAQLFRLVYYCCQKVDY